MTLLFVVDDGKTTAIIVEEQWPPTSLAPARPRRCPERSGHRRRRGPAAAGLRRPGSRALSAASRGRIATRSRSHL